MRRLQILVSSCFFHQTYFLFRVIFFTSFAPSYRMMAVASPIFCGLGTRNVLVTRDNSIYLPDDSDSSSSLAASPNIFNPNGDDELLAEHQSFPSDMNDSDPSDAQPASEPIPNPQPGPPPPSDSRPRPLQKPQPINLSPPQPEPERQLPVPEDLPQPPPVPLAVPGALPVPVPIGPIPEPVSPPRPTDSGQTYPKARPQSQPVGGVRGGVFGGARPDPSIAPMAEPTGESDYPDDDDIRRNFYGVDRDQCVMYTEIGSLQYPRAFAESFTPHKLIYLDAWPYQYLDINRRPFQGFRRFNERVSEIFSRACSGTVFLISKFPGGPEFECSLWSMIEWPALITNPNVEKIILVNYLDFTQQREIWPNPEGETNPKIKRQTDNCHDADLLQYKSYSGIPSGQNIDLTPILGNAAGWASVDVVQYRKNDPDLNPTENFKLDITIIDTHGMDIGHAIGVIAPAGQKVQVTSKLPFALGVMTQADTVDLLFDYGQISWDSNDQSETHKCSFDEWKGATREGICNFDY